MNHAETKLQIQVVNYLRQAAPNLLFFHVPNGEKRDERAGARLKAMGVRAGVPDLAFVLPGGTAAFIELKAGDGKPSPEQRAFCANLGHLGGLYSICNSLDQVEQTLRLWGVDLRGRIAA